MTPLRESKMSYFIIIKLLKQQLAVLWKSHGVYGVTLDSFFVLFCFDAEIGQLEHFFFLQMEQSSFCPSSFSELLLKEAYQLPYDISQKALLCCSVSKISTFYVQINFPSLKFQLIGSSFVCLLISFLHPKGNTSSSSYLSYYVKQNLKLGTFANKSHI